MYETYFGFARRPFAAAPVAAQYFAGEAIEAARQTVPRCIRRAEGAAMVIGSSGTGKTLLCHVLAEQLRDTLAVALLANGRLSTPSALYQSILYALRRSYRGMDEGELRLALVDYLTTCDDRPDGLALLVDEAHTLPLRLLEEIRMLTNLVGAGQSRVRVLLVGGPVLEERFASPRLESFSQRLRVRCYLSALGREETMRYIESQIVRAGGKPSRVLAAEAAEAVYRATDGIPRLVNQLCDHAFLLASSEGVQRVEARLIEEAWADLQQLPSPYGPKEPAAGTGTSTIEFGGLEDETGPDDARQASSPALATSGGSAASDEPLEQVERIERTLAELDEVERACDAIEEGFRPAGSIFPEMELSFEDIGNPFQERFECEETIVQRYRPPRSGSPADAPSEAQPHDGQDAVAAAAEGVASPAARSAGRTGFPIHRPDVAAQSGDEELLLGEDCSDEGPGPQIRVARRPEYRQLFTKLRRG